MFSFDESYFDDAAPCSSNADPDIPEYTPRMQPVDWFFRDSAHDDMNAMKLRAYKLYRQKKYAVARDLFKTVLKTVDFNRAGSFYLEVLESIARCEIKLRMFCDSTKWCSEFFRLSRNDDERFQALYLFKDLFFAKSASGSFDSCDAIHLFAVLALCILKVGKNPFLWKELRDLLVKSSFPLVCTIDCDLAFCQKNVSLDLCSGDALLKSVNKIDRLVSVVTQDIERNSLGFALEPLGKLRKAVESDLQENGVLKSAAEPEERVFDSMVFPDEVSLEFDAVRYFVDQVFSGLLQFR